MTEQSKKKMGGKEKGMIALFLVLMAILTIKSTLLDEVKNLTPEEEQFKAFVEYSVDRDYHGFLEDTHLLVYRVYRIKMADEEQKAVLRYVDEETGGAIEVVQSGRYEAAVRGYLLWILPVKQFSVTAEVEE